jgi:hypothetical protein
MWALDFQRRVCPRRKAPTKLYRLCGHNNYTMYSPPGYQQQAMRERLSQKVYEFG